MRIFLSTSLSVVGIVLLAFSYAHFPTTSFSGTVDSLHIEKRKRQLTAYINDTSAVTYPVALSLDPTGPKRFRGDWRVPEGQYHIDFHVPKDDAFAYKALYLSYPNASDRKYARRHGRNPGGAIEIHGLHWSMAWMGRIHTAFDYTLGCIAVTNDQMDDLYEHVPDGTPIRITP